MVVVCIPDSCSVSLPSSEPVLLLVAVVRSDPPLEEFEFVEVDLVDVESWLVNCWVDGLGAL